MTAAHTIHGSPLVAQKTLKLRYETGTTWTIDDLPPRSIALDGAVQGPHIDLSSQRFSFDHHAGCIRHVTLATCEQVRDALLVGFDPDQFTVWVNDVDGDTVLSFWLLQNAGELFGPRQQELLQLIQHVGRIDALGPGYGGYAKGHPLHWHLTPNMTQHRTEALFLEKLAFLQRYWEDPSIVQSQTPPARQSGYAMWIENGQIHQAEIDSGMEDLYKKAHFGVIWADALHNSRAYTVGKRSEFVDFSVPQFLAAMNALEAGWGGGSTIGGAPRHTDGSRSRLSPDEVGRVFLQVAAGK